MLFIDPLLFSKKKRLLRIFAPVMQTITGEYQVKGADGMSHINQQELQSLRHLIGAHETAHQKMLAYAQQAVDPQVKAYFQKSAQDALNTKQQLMSFLN